jgi:hypothetical protein
MRNYVVPMSQQPASHFAGSFAPPSQASSHENTYNGRTALDRIGFSELEKQMAQKVAQRIGRAPSQHMKIADLQAVFRCCVI